MQDNSDRSINVGGSFKGVANTGDRSVIKYDWNQARNEDIAEFVMEIFEELVQRFPDVSSCSEAERQTLVKMELQQKTRNNPTLRARLLSSAKAGGAELAKVLTNNPFVSVSLEAVKGWLEAESS